MLCQAWQKWQNKQDIPGCCCCIIFRISASIGSSSGASPLSPRSIDSANIANFWDHGVNWLNKIQWDFKPESLATTKTSDRQTSWKIEENQKHANFQHHTAYSHKICEKYLWDYAVEDLSPSCDDDFGTEPETSKESAMLQGWRKFKFFWGCNQIYKYNIIICNYTWRQITCSSVEPIFNHYRVQPTLANTCKLCWPLVPTGTQPMYLKQVLVLVVPVEVVEVVGPSQASSQLGLPPHTTRRSLSPGVFLLIPSSSSIASILLVFSKLIKTCCIVLPRPRAHSYLNPKASVQLAALQQTQQCTFTQCKESNSLSASDKCGDFSPLAANACAT